MFGCSVSSLDFHISVMHRSMLAANAPVFLSVCWCTSMCFSWQLKTFTISSGCTLSCGMVIIFPVLFSLVLKLVFCHFWVYFKSDRFLSSFLHSLFSMFFTFTCFFLLLFSPDECDCACEIFLKLKFCKMLEKRARKSVSLRVLYVMLVTKIFNKI